MRIHKLVLSLTLLLLLIPAVSANAATGAYTNSVTSNSLWLYWTLQPGEGYVKINLNGSYYTTVAGNGYYMTGLSPCTTYTFDVLSGNGLYGSTSTTATTLGCDPTPTAPVISYTSTYYAVNLSWSSTNATSYEIYKDNVFVTNTTSASYALYSNPSSSFSVKIVAKNNTGQSAYATQTVSTTAFTNFWTASLGAGNIRVGGAFTNTNSTYGTTMSFTLYRVTGSGDLYVGSNSVYIGPSQTVGGWYNLATAQPSGTYKVVLNSTYATTSGVSLGNY